MFGGRGFTFFLVNHLSECGVSIPWYIGIIGEKDLGVNDFS